MIQMMSRLSVVDNTGVKIIRVIGVHHKKSRQGIIGDMVTASVREVKGECKFKKGDVVRALIVRMRAELPRKDGRKIKFSDNAAIMLANDLKPIGTRIAGPLPIELRTDKWIKVMSLSPYSI